MRAFCIILFCLSISCNFNKTSEQIIEQEINSINTIEEQITFLENILKQNEKVRARRKRIFETYSQYSDAYKNVNFNMIRISGTNLSKVEAFLKKFDHPTPEKHGTKVADIPCIIIHQSPGGLEARHRNFIALHDAYQIGYISKKVFSEYLNRMYQISKGVYIQPTDKPQDTLDIDVIIKKMKLLG